VAALGTDQVRGIELAVAEVDGQLLGHPLELQAEDDLCSAEGGTTAALKIVADPQVVAILGSTCSGAAVTEAKVMSEAGLVMISGINTAPSLTAVGGKQGANWQPGYFRTAHNDANQGRAAAIFAFQELGIRQAATIHDGDAYTSGLVDVFGQVFEELGGTIMVATAINKGDTNMQPVLEAVAASSAQLVFLPIFSPESDLIALQAQEVEGFEKITLMSADASLSPAFIEATGAAGIGTYFVGPNTPASPAYDTFVSNYRTAYGEAPISGFHGHAYDAAKILFTAIEKIAVREENGTLHLGRQSLRDALYAIAEYQGLTGTLTCDEFGDCGAANFKVVRLDDPAAGMEGLANNVIYTYIPGE
jgi:branched-chain amino acid transport system substrate-binding protein